MLDELQEPPVPLRCSPATPCCDTSRHSRQGRVSAPLCHHHPFVPCLWACPRPAPWAALPAADFLPLGLSQAWQSSVGVSPWHWELRSVPWGEWDGRKHSHNSSSSLQTMQTMDIMLKKLMLGCRVSRVSEMLQDIFQVWHVQRVGFTRALARWGVRSGVDSPTPCHAERVHCWGAALLPGGTRGCPPGSSSSQWPQRVASAFLPGCRAGPGSQACEGPQGRNLTTGFAQDQRKP